MDAAAATAAGDDEQYQARLDAIADGLQTRDAYALPLPCSISISLSCEEEAEAAAAHPSLLVSDDMTPPSAHPCCRMRLYNWLSHRCFSDCVVSFYRRALGRREEECVRSCVRKYLLLSAATAARFPHLADSSSSSSSAAFDD
jgi:import inner membrane translocase subunit TIM9